MSLEQNKANVHRILTEGLRDAKVAQALLDANYINHSFPVPARGPEGWAMIIGMFVSAFPDIQLTIEDVIAEGNRVVTRGTFSGTHKGEFMGVPPTGKTFKSGYIDIWVVENGKLKENWEQMDTMGMMQQLGVIPAPA